MVNNKSGKDADFFSHKKGEWPFVNHSPVTYKIYLIKPVCDLHSQSFA